MFVEGFTYIISAKIGFNIGQADSEEIRLFDKSETW